MAWTTISDATLEVGKALRALTMRNLRDNIAALAAGDAGAPQIQTAAIAASAVTTAKIAAGSVTTATIADSNVTTGKIATGAVAAWNEQGAPVLDAVGELVCTAPIPSMPLYFWGDIGHARYLSSYFDMYPGVWRHGDWLRILPQGGCVIYGRSDATINRYGLRMGTSELYSAVESLPEVLDAMVVDLEYLGRESYMPLFVVLREGLVLDDALRGRLNQSIREALSPRFVPNEIFQVEAIPRTLSGKKQELPIKKLLLGQPIDKVVNREAMANPQCLAWYEAFARAHQSAVSQH